MNEKNISSDVFKNNNNMDPWPGWPIMIVNYVYLHKTQEENLHLWNIYKQVYCTETYKNNTDKG